MSHIVKVDDYQFMPRPGQTLLESLEQEKVEVQYQCRQGYCGACQMTLIDGEVEYREEPIAFIPKGRILPCCCEPASDLSLETVV